MSKFIQYLHMRRIGMDNLKQAYETLGLSENASREEVEKTFELLLRRSKGKAGEEITVFEQQLKAYKFIINYNDQAEIEKMSAERYRKYGKYANRAEKTSDFFRLHKTKVFVSIISIVVVIVALTTYLNHLEEQKRLAALPPIDLSILYMGNFMVDEKNNGEEVLEKALLQQFSQFKRFELKFNYMPPANKDGLTGDALAYQQKAFTVIATERPDIYVTDQTTFEWIGKMGAFKSLDEEVAGRWKSFVNEKNAIKLVNEDDQKEHIYGIDLSDNELFNGLPLFKDKAILTIRDGEGNLEKAIQFIEHFLQNSSETKK